MFLTRMLMMHDGLPGGIRGTARPGGKRRFCTRSYLPLASFPLE